MEARWSVTKDLEWMRAQPDSNIAAQLYMKETLYQLRLFDIAEQVLHQCSFVP